MKLAFNLTHQLDLLLNTVYLFKKHFLIILGLGLIAAFGRVIQLGGFGEITPWINIVLEVLIESARTLIFLYVLGLASIKDGALRIKRLFTQKDNRRLKVTDALQKLKQQWFLIVLNTSAFLIIAIGINYLIDLLAYETCLFLTLKKMEY